MANYLIKFGDIDLSDIVEEMSIENDNSLTTQQIPGRHGVRVDSILTLSIRKIRMRARLIGATKEAIRTQATELKAELGTARQQLYAGLDDVFYNAYKTKFSLTFVEGQAALIGLVDMEFVADDPELLDNTQGIVIDWFRQVQIIQPDGGPDDTVTTYPGFSFVNQTGTRSKYWDSDGPWARMTTVSTAINVFAGLTRGTGTVHFQFNPKMWMEFKTGSTITDGLWMAGLDSGSTGSPGASSDYLIFIYDDVVHGDGIWRIRSHDGVGSPNELSTGIAIAPNTKYQIIIDATNTSEVSFTINGSLVGSFTTNLPTANALIGWRCSVMNKVAGTSHYIDFKKGHMEYE